MNERKRRILLITSGIFHPPLLGRASLAGTLLGLKKFALQPLSSLEQLPENFGNIAALVIYFHQRQLSDHAFSSLGRFIAGGGGLLAVHSASASFKQNRHYFEILGGRFRGHKKVALLRVTAEGRNADDPFAGIGSFTIEDELYIHDLQPGIRIHFSAVAGSETAPIVWTYLYGRGRVCYASPGHTLASMKHPAMQEILRRGLRWVAREEDHPGE